MARGRQSSLVFADIWGDTVNVKDLGGAMVIGVVLGFLSYTGGLELVKIYYPAFQESLQQAIALVAGIAGCVLAAVVSAKIYRPKRTMVERNLSESDRKRMLEDLQIDYDAEEEAMKTMPPDTLAEMEELKLVDLFRRPTTQNGRG